MFNRPNSRTHITQRHSRYTYQHMYIFYSRLDAHLFLKLSYLGRQRDGRHDEASELCIDVLQWLYVQRYRCNIKCRHHHIFKPSRHLLPSPGFNVDIHLPQSLVLRRWYDCRSHRQIVPRAPSSSESLSFLGRFVFLEYSSLTPAS